MSTPFQNRLVGTFIVAAVAAIFLPDILDGKKQSYQSEFENIPPAPAVVAKQQGQSFPQQEVEALQDKPSLVDEVALDDQPTDKLNNDQENAQHQTVSANPVEKESQLKAKVKVNSVAKSEKFDDQQSKTPATTQARIQQKLPEKSVPTQAWVIQLGSFKHKKNVDSLVSKLKSNGYTAFTKPIQTQNGTLTKVFVGPELIKSSLEKKIPKLKQLTNVEGKVARFYPTK